MAPREVQPVWSWAISGRWPVHLATLQVPTAEEALLPPHVSKTSQVPPVLSRQLLWPRRWEIPQVPSFEEVLLPTPESWTSHLLLFLSPVAR